MTSTKGLIDGYKADLKTKEAELSKLEERTAVVEDIRQHADSARYWLRDVEQNLSAVEGTKEAVKGGLMDALLSGRDDDVTTNREQYRVLEEERAELEAERSRLLGIIEANTVNDVELARLKAALHTFNGPSGSELVKGIQDIIKGDSDSLKERAKTAGSLLPDVDPRSTHRALMELDESYRANGGEHLDEYLQDMDDKGESDAATALLASRLEARERRAMVAAEK